MKSNTGLHFKEIRTLVSFPLVIQKGQNTYMEMACNNDIMKGLPSNDHWPTPSATPNQFWKATK